MVWRERVACGWEGFSGSLLPPPSPLGLSARYCLLQVLLTSVTFAHTPPTPLVAGTQRIAKEGGEGRAGGRVPRSIRNSISRGPRSNVLKGLKARPGGKANIPPSRAHHRTRYGHVVLHSSGLRDQLVKIPGVASSAWALRFLPPLPCASYSDPELDERRGCFIKTPDGRSKCSLTCLIGRSGKAALGPGAHFVHFGIHNRNCCSWLLGR